MLQRFNVSPDGHYEHRIIPPRTYETIEIKPHSRVLGAEVDGVDLTKPLSRQTLAELRHAIGDYLVLFFRDQNITHDQHIAFGESFGELEVHPAAPHVAGHPEMIQVAINRDSKSIRQIWHSDVSCNKVPPGYSILRLTKGPAVGGDTLFVSCCAAYDALSGPMKEFLSGLSAVHASDHIFRGRYRNVKEDIGRTFPEHVHPIVRTHPLTGRKSLFVNHGYTTKIPELSYEESYAILSMLLQHLEKPDFQCRFRWEDHSIAMWDNRCTNHRATWDFWPDERIVFRVTLKGEEVQ